MFTLIFLVAGQLVGFGSPNIQIDDTSNFTFSNNITNAAIKEQIEAAEQLLSKLDPNLKDNRLFSFNEIFIHEKEREILSEKAMVGRCELNLMGDTLYIGMKPTLMGKYKTLSGVQLLKRWHQGDFSPIKDNKYLKLSWPLLNPGGQLAPYTEKVFLIAKKRVLTKLGRIRDQLSGQDAETNKVLQIAKELGNKELADNLSQKPDTWQQLLELGEMLSLRDAQKITLAFYRRGAPTVDIKGLFSYGNYHRIRVNAFSHLDPAIDKVVDRLTNDIRIDKPKFEVLGIIFAGFTIDEVDVDAFRLIDESVMEKAFTELLFERLKLDE